MKSNAYDYYQEPLLQIATQYMVHILWNNGPNKNKTPLLNFTWYFNPTVPMFRELMHQ